MTDATPTDDEFPGLDEILGDPALWHEPPADLEDAVVAAIQAEAAARPPASGAAEPVVGAGRPAPSARPGRWLQLVAAAVLVVVGFGAAMALDRTSGGGAGDPDELVALAGTDLAPGASAVAEVTARPAGVRIILDVSGLDPAPPGFYYQAWMRSADEGVTAGTFHLRGGDAAIELWSGVPLEDYPILTVTLQEEGAGPASSGVVVLRGEVTP